MLNKVLEQKVLLIVICLVIVLFLPLAWLGLKRAELKECDNEQQILNKLEYGISALMTIQFSILACGALYYAAKITLWR